MKCTVLCACGENGREDCILRLSLELVKVGVYDFPHPHDGLFFKRLFKDIAFDMPDVEHRLCLIYLFIYLSTLFW
jgi:hypothetical protein